MTRIDWAALRHAFGSAADIPALLTRARSAAAPEGYRDEPWFSLWSSLYHQDDIYSASYAALPELVEIATGRGGAVARESLLLAASIELRRNQPNAPPLPAGLQADYLRAVQAGASLTRAMLTTGQLSGDALARVEISDAVFRGDHVRAVQLLRDDNGLGQEL